MIQELLTREDLIPLVQQWRELVHRLGQDLAAGSEEAKALAQKHGWAEDDVAALDELLARAEKGFAHSEEGAYITPDPELSLVQTILERAYVSADMVQESNKQGAAGAVPAMTGRSLKDAAKPSAVARLWGSPFDDPNPRYLTEGLKAMNWTRKNGKHPFSTDPVTFSLATKARLVLVGDWGTGLERADVIAGLMRRALEEAGDRERHAVHLGDIYFCGWPAEAQERFLDHWPIHPGETFAHSWCLNGNHDMYSGGHGLFQVVLGDERFREQNGCSYFLMENEHWRLFALDSAYDEWSFSHGQLAFLEKPRAGKKSTILLSHHQPFSAYEGFDGARRLRSEVAGLLEAGAFTAWLWGHEHRCAAYAHPELELPGGKWGQLPFGCCLGHGGVPSKPTKLKDGVLYALQSTFPAGPFDEIFGKFGFAILDLDGARAELSVVDEDGVCLTFAQFPPTAPPTKRRQL